MPPTSKIKKEHKELCALIEKHNHQYFLENNPTITDKQYDKLFRQLQELEVRYPQLQAPDSPTQKVGAPAADRPFAKKEASVPESFGRIKQAHLQSMFSLQNAFDEEEVVLFHERVVRTLGVVPKHYFCQPKLDGLAVSIIYKKGQLVTGLTRGDGQQGEVITENVKTISNVPHMLKAGYPDLLEVRGEVIISKKDFQHLNKKQEKAGLEPFVSARNAASGSLRQLDVSVSGSRPLQFYFHSVGEMREKTCATQWELEAFLNEIGLPTLGLSCSLKEVHNGAGFLACHLEDVLAYYRLMREQAPLLPIEIDGVVIKINDRDLQKKLGHTARHPRWAIAGKFHSEKIVTQVQNIVIQVGRTGVLTPVADLQPVQLDGVTVQRATLHNACELARKDIRVGDYVRVQRAGGVIPAIIDVLKGRRPGKTKPFVFPENCPICHRPVAIEDAIIRCTYSFCTARLKKSLEHFASKKAMNIEGLGTQWIETLVDTKKIKSFSDIYRLKVEDLLVLERQGEVSSQKIIKSIQKSKEPTLAAFLFALNIPHVGEQVALWIAQNIQNVSQLEKITETELSDIEGVGAVVAKSFVLHIQGLQEEISALLALGVVIQPLSQPVQKSQKRIVITGTLPIPRTQVKEQLMQQGWRVTSQVTSQTEALLVGEKPSTTKINTAKKYHVPLLTWQEVSKPVVNRTLNT